MLLPKWAMGFLRPLAYGLVAAVLTAVFSLSMPNYYRSEARILPVDTKGNGGGLGNLAVAAAAFGVGFPGENGSDGNYPDILASRWLREQLLNTEFHFHYRTGRLGPEREVTETLYQHLQVKNMDRGIAAMAQILTCSRDMKSRVLSISAETRSPELSQQIVRRATALLESFLLGKGRTRGGNKALFAEERLKEAQKEYDRVEDEYRRFMDGNRNSRVSSDPGVNLRGLRLEAELKMRQQLVSTLAVHREQALLEEKDDVPILNILDAGAVPLEKSRPSRANLVLSVFVLVAATSWAWLNRQRLRDLLVEN